MEIQLDILWLNEEQKGMQDAGMHVPFYECITRNHTFYNISYIRSADEKGYSEVASDGELYITKVEYSELRGIIKNNINFKLN